MNNIYRLEKDARLESLEKGEPDARFNTLLRVLQVDHPMITSLMILNHKIEKCILVSSRREGDDLTGFGIFFYIFFKFVLISNSFAYRISKKCRTCVYIRLS